MNHAYRIIQAFLFFFESALMSIQTVVICVDSLAYALTPYYRNKSKDKC